MCDYMSRRRMMETIASLPSPSKSSPFFTGMFYLYIRNVSVKKGEKQIISHHILIYVQPLPTDMVWFFQDLNNK